MATFCTSRPHSWTPPDRSTVHSRRLARVLSPRKTTASEDAVKNKLKQVSGQGAGRLIFGCHQAIKKAERRLVHAQHCQEVRDAQNAHKRSDSAQRKAAARPKEKFVLRCFARVPSRLVDVISTSLPAENDREKGHFVN